MKFKRIKFSPNFERDYHFYLSNKNTFNFPGTDVKKDFGIQFPEEKLELDEEGSPMPFSIPYSITGRGAKSCFYLLDSEGKNSPCFEPELLVELLTCKASINLQIKMWAQGRAEYTISKYELEEYVTHYGCPEWVFTAVENQKNKIIKEWAAQKKWNQHGFYKEAMALNMGECLQDMSLSMKLMDGLASQEIIPDKIIMIEESKKRLEKTLDMEFSKFSDTVPMKKWVPDTVPMNIPVITLYRPVGGLEYHLIMQSEFKKFPPRLISQPIFYPVASEEYAVKIARDWNTKDKENGSIGYVLKFNIRKAYISMYPTRYAGGIQHQEYWIPADHLERFNNNIIGKIEVVHVFKGK